MLSLGGATQLGIGIAVVLQDRFTNTANRVNSSILGMKKNFHAAAFSAMQDYRNQQAAISLGALALSRGMYGMAKDGAEIQHKINQIAIIGGDQLRKNGFSREKLVDMSNVIGQEFAERPGQMADAMLENVRAGVKTNLALITRYQTAAAKITGETLGGEEGVAKKLLGIQHSMGINSSEFGRVANATSAAANLSMASISSIGESMEYSAFTAKQYGVSLEKTLAIVAKLSQASIEGSSAGTGMNNMFIQLGKSLGHFRTQKQLESWQLLGLSPDVMKQMLDGGQIFEVIAAIEDASKKLGASDKTSVLGNLLNIRGTRAALAAFGDPNNPQNSLTNLLAGIKSGVRNDIAIKQGTAASNDLSSDMVRAQAKWDSFKRSFSEAAAPTLRLFLGISNKLLGVLDAVVSSPIGKVFAGLLITVVPLIAVITAFRAAMMAATIMAVQYSKAQQMGGFTSLMGAGMGMLPKMGGKSAQMAQMINAGQVRKNAAGRWIVAAGHNPMWQGVPRRGFMPSSFNPSANLVNGVAMGGMMGAGGSIGSKIAGFASKAGPWMGRIAGWGAKAIPILGEILMAVSVISWIYDIVKDKSKDEPPQPRDMMEFYLKQLNQNLVPVSNGVNNNNPALNNNKAFEQRLNIYIDGTKTVDKKIQMGFQAVDANYIMQHF